MNISISINYVNINFYVRAWMWHLFKSSWLSLSLPSWPLLDHLLLMCKAALVFFSTKKMYNKLIIIHLTLSLPKSELILPTSDHAKLWWLFRRIWQYAMTLSQVDSFLRVSLPVCVILYSDCKENLFVTPGVCSQFYCYWYQIVNFFCS